MDRKHVRILVAVFMALLMMAPLAIAAIPSAEAARQGAIPPGTIDPKTIPQFVNQLNGPPPVYVPDNTWFDITSGRTEENYTVTMTEFNQQVLPAPLSQTLVWGYGGEAKDALTGASMGFVSNSPAPSFEARKGVPINVNWVNQLTNPHHFAVDPTLHWANPNNMPDHVALTPPYPAYPSGFPAAQQNVTVVPHVHGLEVQSTSDGNPDAWWTANGVQGPAYNTYAPTDANAAVFHYPNEQLPATLWYHDHALGITRINVMSGLAGYYFLRDPLNDTAVAPNLPSGKYEMPLAIQDRTFNLDGSFSFPTAGLNPTIHPYWMPEFFGNTIMVNGLVWPNMNVDQGQYRFRLLDGSNARFYTFSLDLNKGGKLPFTVIGTEGGYLRSPVTMNQLTVAPGERYDILVDFTGLKAGTKITMTNSAKSPMPAGSPPDPQTTGRIMQFTVTANLGFTPMTLPAILNPTVSTYPSLTTASKTRIMVLTEIMGPLGPTEILLNGLKWMAMVTEDPELGATEEWVIVNPTADVHPIHLHLVTFQVISRQAMDTKKYYNDWVMMQTTAGGGTLPVGSMPAWPMDYMPMMQPIAPYLKGKVVPAPANEMGWKDTFQVNPGEVAILRARWSPNDGSDSYPFSATDGPGYVWHCHIIDHEDNEMMRPYYVKE